jgi:hypothetical protein
MFPLSSTAIADASENWPSFSPLLPKLKSGGSGVGVGVGVAGGFEAKDVAVDVEPLEPFVETIINPRIPNVAMTTTVIPRTRTKGAVSS